MEQSGRARSLLELKDLPRLDTDEGRRTGLWLQLRPSDIVITPFGKSGTTWTQQIVHTLRTGGDMDFDDISRVVPWIEMSTDLGLDLDAEQRANPRAFKSHLTWDEVPKGGRYIVVLRNPADAAVSAFKFMEGWFIEPGSIAVDEFVSHAFLRQRNYYKHLRSWWGQRLRPDVLLLAYEHMLRDPERAIRQIAAFAEIDLDAQLLAVTLRHSSLEFMLEHKDRFDDALMRARSEQVAGLPANSDSAKVRAGKSGSGDILHQATRNQLEDVWREEIEQSLGLESYADALSRLALERA